MIRETFEEITSRLDGCKVIALVGMDGILIDQLPLEDRTNIDQLAAEYAAVVKGARDAQKECGEGNLEELMFLSERSIVISHCLNRDYFFFLALRPDGNLGRARFEMKKGSQRLRSEIED
ncbi:MAG: hypothetical protein V3U66_05705 [Acidobacteriota bacterium]